MFPQEAQNSLRRSPHFSQNFVVTESFSLHSGFPHKMYLVSSGSSDIAGENLSVGLVAITFSMFSRGISRLFGQVMHDAA